MIPILRSLRLNRLAFWKSRKYIAWRLHTAYGVDYESGLFNAIFQVMRKTGFRQFLKDGIRLNHWLKEINKKNSL